MRKKNFLARAKPEDQNKKREVKFAVFDIETEGIGGAFIEGCVRFEDRPGEYVFVQSSSELVQTMVNNPHYRYYAHNGGGFDFCYIISDLLDLQRRTSCSVSIIKQGVGRVIGFKIDLGACEHKKEGKKCRCKKKILDIRDSFALINISLAKASETFCPGLPKLHSIDFEGGEVYDPANPVHKEYLKRDCDALLAVLRRYEFKIAELYGSAIGYTAGSTAIKAWEQFIPEGHVYYRLQHGIEDFCRCAYYGGYVYPGQEAGEHSDTSSIDYNGAYAAVMLEGVPTGNPDYTREYDDTMFGIYEVVAHVPRSCTSLPFIPSRDKNGMLQWVTGDFKTIITSTEIEFGKVRGCTFDIIRGYVWRRWEYPFQEFLGKCQAMELEGGELKEIAKLKRNSLYGKFGTKSEQESFVLGPDCPEKGRPYFNEQTMATIPGLWVVEEKADAPYIQPHWAAVITMKQRLKEITLLEQLGKHARYADTDSIKGDTFAIQRLIDTGLVTIAPVYGAVKIDECYDSFICFGPKSYCGYTRDGKFVGKTKGIPKRYCLPDKYEQVKRNGISEPIEFVSMNSPMLQMKGKAKGVSQMRKRRISMLNSNSWYWDKQGQLQCKEVSLPSPVSANFANAQYRSQRNTPPRSFEEVSL